MEDSTTIIPLDNCNSELAYLQHLQRVFAEPQLSIGRSNRESLVNRRWKKRNEENYQLYLQHFKPP